MNRAAPGGGTGPRQPASAGIGSGGVKLSLTILADPFRESRIGKAMTGQHGSPGQLWSAEVERIASDLTAGSTDSAARLFAANAAGAPVVVWEPSSADLRHPVLRSFARLCAEGAAGAAPLAPDRFAALDLSAVSDWLMVLERTPDGRDLRYAHYGREIAAVYGRDMTGHRTSEIGGHVSVFFLALYEAAARRRRWVYSMHEPPAQIFARSWRRLIVPVEAPDGGVGAFATVNVPDDELRPGLEAVPDPVLLLDEAGHIRFANTAAQVLFGMRSFSGEDVGLDAYCGFTLDLSHDPIAGCARTVESRAVAHFGNMVVQFAVTHRGILHRDRVCHVVVIKPD